MLLCSHPCHRGRRHRCPLRGADGRRPHGAGLPRLPSRVFAALVVDDDGRMTAAELAKTLAVSPAAISGAVSFLSQISFLHREREPGSRRDVYVVDDDAWLQAMMRKDQTYAPMLAALGTALRGLADDAAGAAPAVADAGVPGLRRRGDGRAGRAVAGARGPSSRTAYAGVADDGLGPTVTDRHVGHRHRPAEPRPAPRIARRHAARGPGARAVAAVRRGGELLWGDGIGVADVGRGRAPGADDQFLVASNSKTFTAVMVMQLRDEGRLDLDDRLGRPPARGHPPRHRAAGARPRLRACSASRSATSGRRWCSPTTRSC